MCRSIKTLRRVEGRAEDREVEEAALQFVRKISGFSRPAAANEKAFQAAVEQVSAASRRLLDTLPNKRSGGSGPARTITSPTPSSRRRA
jgi:hypothetical protein